MGGMATLFPLLMIIVKNYWYVTIMRGLVGLSVGFASALSSLYANSMVDASIKGRIGSLFQLSVTLFIFIAQLMNYLFIPEFDVDNCVPLSDVSWRMQLGASCLLGVGLCITLMFAPEMKEEHEVRKEVKAKESLYTQKNIRWILFALMLAVMNQLTGINGVMYYCAQILSSAGIGNVLFTQMIVVGLWNMLTVFIFMAIVDCMSRRSIFMIALAVMLVGTIALIIRFRSVNTMTRSFMATNVPVVALIGMVLYILGFESGPGPLFYVMATQDFPKELVAQGLARSNVLLYVLNIILTLFFPILTSSIGAGYTFIILAGFQLLSLVYFGFFRNEKCVVLHPIQL